MKILIIARHGEAEQPGMAVKDFDRELTGEGMKSAIKAGTKLRDLLIKPELILASASARTYYTARLIAEQLRIEDKYLLRDETLYEASAGALLQKIRALPAKHDVVMFVGHNPTVTYLTEFLSGEHVALNTGNIAVMEFDLTSWDAIDQRLGKLKHFITNQE